ncbi:MAG: DNA repair protein RecO [Chloroflexi bacterium]|nr:DNA repair protein RecO [Chloroflexota bacterium]
MPRPRTYRVEAIVLRRVDFGEADRVLVLLTRERGKLPVVAKGIRRLSSRSAGHLELFTDVELQLAKGANLDVVTQAETRNAFRRVREDLTRTSTAYLIAETADALTEEAVEQPELFDLLVATFHALETTDDPRLLAAHYQLRLLDVTGFRPVLMTCVGCDQELQPGQNAFSAMVGGALCPRCGPSEPSSRPIHSDVLKVLRNLQRAGLPGSVHFRVPEQTIREVERTLRDLLERHTERRLRTPDLLARLRADAPAALPSAAPPEPAEVAAGSTPE